MFMKDLHLECMKMLPMCCWMVKGGHEVKTLILVFSFKFVLIRGIVTGKRWPSGTPLTSELRLPYKILRDPVPGTSRPSGFSHPTILATTLPHFAIWYLHTSTHDSLLRCSWECFPPSPNSHCPCYCLVNIYSRLKLTCLIPWKTSCS